MKVIKDVFRILDSACYNMHCRKMVLQILLYDVLQLFKMVNKCVAYGCDAGANLRVNEDPATREATASFHFPHKNEDLMGRWVKFVNRADWKPKPTSVLCERHFSEEYITRGKRCTLKWNLNPIPTKHSSLAKKRPSTLPDLSTPRKAPKIRNIEPDQMQDFLNMDKIESFADIDIQKHCPPGYSSKKEENSIIFYMTASDELGFPRISRSIRIDNNMHIKLQCNGRMLPLPKWFITAHNAKLTRYSMLDNFPQYLKSAEEAHPPSILDELRKIEYYQGKGRPPYSVEVMRYALLQRYTSAAAYRLMLKEFPLPSFSLLYNIQRGGPDAMKTVRVLHETGAISTDVILMADEMYLQASAQYHAGSYVGCSGEGKLYKGIVCFLIVGLQKSVPVVVRAVPECTVNGELNIHIATFIILV